MTQDKAEPSRIKARARVKAWTPKVRTGCRTCKRRKIKCDESKPSCTRCLRAKIICDGYDALPETWIFENPQLQESPESKSSIVNDDSKRKSFNSSVTPLKALAVHTKSPSQASICAECWRPIHQCTCAEVAKLEQVAIRDVSSRAASLLRTPSSPYKTAEEQFFFRYFMEVAGVSVSRSDISSTFWLSYFPQAAYQQPAVRDALLSVSTLFQSLTKHIWLQKPAHRVHLRAALAYENRAIELIVADTPSIECVLVASCAFWFSAISSADWIKSLQHAYYALKIIKTVADRRKYDVLILRYAEIIATASLAYFRATRGACKLHPGGSLTDCDLVCYTPEVTTVEMRVADALYHLQNALLRLKVCTQILHSCREPHRHEARITDIIQKQTREVRFLIRRWSNAKHLGLSERALKDASEVVPITFSPFTPIQDGLQDFIENGDKSKLTFTELELRMRVLLPNFMTATGQGHPVLLTDTATLVFVATYGDGRRQLSEEPGRQVAAKIVAEYRDG